MLRKTLVVYHEKCTGCRLCEAVCALSHEEKMDLTLSRIQVDPSSESTFRPKVCRGLPEAGHSICLIRGSFEFGVQQYL